MQVGVAKMTSVFLSWLNGALMGTNFFLVCLIVMGVGYVMFLLPPVPGVPVYVFIGIVVSAQGANTPGVGFWGGVGIAAGIAFVLKLLACCGQYAIGYLAGRSVGVQQLIGVDTVPTRAVEAILKTDGFTV